ncbi:MAG TPA: beta-ketoacyl synthase N-terminal-like domain-containing protein [Streptosporangiaceae bacterium]|jgi:3-oxoacyl-[acyl-carrier-protein] synthase II
MSDAVAVAPPPVARRGVGSVVITGAGALSAYGRGTETLLSGVLSGRPAFAPVQRFDVTTRRVGFAATMPGAPDLVAELVRAVGDACDDAGLSSAGRARSPLFLAVHGDPAIARVPEADRPRYGPDALAAEIVSACHLTGQGMRCYTSACVAASTAIADAAAMIARGHADRVVVAGGYLVDHDQFALFDTGRVLAADGQVRPFSSGRRGLLLGDGVGAVVVESQESARARGAAPLARVAGWGRTGDAYHPCQPHPDGLGLARAVRAALERAGLAAQELGYINAHGSGTGHSDPSEASGLRLALGDAVEHVPVSSTKSLHGQCLEASGVVELIVTLLTARKGMLPVNAGFLGPDDNCRLNLVLGSTQAGPADYAMSLNAAFGGANTALVIGLP